MVCLCSCWFSKPASPPVQRAVVSPLHTPRTSSPVQTAPSSPPRGPKYTSLSTTISPLQVPQIAMVDSASPDSKLEDWMSRQTLRIDHFFADKGLQNLAQDLWPRLKTLQAETTAYSHAQKAQIYAAEDKMEAYFETTCMTFLVPYFQEALAKNRVSLAGGMDDVVRPLLQGFRLDTVHFLGIHAVFVALKRMPEDPNIDKKSLHTYFLNQVRKGVLAYLLSPNQRPTEALLRLLQCSNKEALVLRLQERLNGGGHDLPRPKTMRMYDFLESLFALPPKSLTQFPGFEFGMR